MSKTTKSLRQPTLRDAKALGLLPGVTGICKIYPGAINWWSEDIRIAGEVGTRRHKAVEQYHYYPQIGDQYCSLTKDSEDYPYIAPYINWFGKNVVLITEAESVVVNVGHGYAGTMDLHCRLVDSRTAVVDLKNRKNLATYDTDAMQLAAYRRAVGADVGISVVLGTEKPEILVREWTVAEDEQAWQKFELCLKLFKLSNNYYPELWKPKEEAA